MTKLEAEIIVRLADNQLNVAEVARKMFMHRNSIVYHIKKVHRISGMNPLDFHDMCKLLPKAKVIIGRD